MKHDIKHPHLQFFSGAGCLHVSGVIEMGKRRFEAGADLDVAEILRVASFLAPVNANEQGHAFYHAERRDAPYPCEMCPSAVHASREMRRELRVRKFETSEIVKVLDVTGKADSIVEKTEMGLLRNMNLEEYGVDDVWFSAEKKGTK